MQLVFFTDSKFFKAKSGNVYSLSGNFPASLWDRYLSVFDRILVVARMEEGSSEEGNPAHMASRNGVSFFELPSYLGALGFLRNFSCLKRKILEAIEKNLDSAFLCRVPSGVGEIASHALRKRKIKYGVEVVGDPWVVFSPGSISHPLRPLLRLRGLQQLRKCVHNSSAAIYVTKDALQKRYPVKPNVFCTYASDVVCPKSWFAKEGRKRAIHGSCNLLSVGSLSQMYKAPDIILKAISGLKKKGIECRLRWLGGGRYLPSLISMSSELGIENIVTWSGIVSREEVEKALCEADIFLLVSRTEGLPRALVEAMAKGCPCIGSDVGGIPELLSPDVIVPAGDAYALEGKIMLFCKNQEFLFDQSLRNLQKAHEFEEGELFKKQNQFYQVLRALNDESNSCSQ